MVVASTTNTKGHLLVEMCQRYLLLGVRSHLRRAVYYLVCEKPQRRNWIRRVAVARYGLYCMTNQEYF